MSGLKSSGPKIKKCQLSFKTVWFSHFWSAILNFENFEILKFGYQIWNHQAKKPLTTKNDKISIGVNNSGLF